MEKIQSKEELDEKLGQMKHGKTNLLGNLALLHTAAEESRLYLIDAFSNSFYLMDEGHYYRLYYNIASFQEKHSFASIEKEMLVDVACNKQPSDEKMEALLSSLGFERVKTAIKMRCRADSLGEKGAVAGLEVRNRFSDMSAIQQILRSNFDEKFDQIPTLAEIERLHQSGNFCFFYYENRFTGLVLATTDKIRLNILHICTLEKGKGYATQMMDFLFNKISQEELKEISLWVNEENIQARSLYKKYEFQEEKKYVLKYSNQPSNYNH